MVEAATEFRKNSFNDSDSATLAKVATMFTNVADESMSAADSASFIIAQMKAFNIEADDAYRIIDSVNAVSNNYAVSSGQLAQNLGNMSAAMATGNNTFEQSLGMLTAMTEITRNAAKGSRALITVQGRLNQVVDESSDTGKALTAWYQEHAIAIKDDEGQVRSLYEVLTDVAKIWPKLTKNEQMYYLQQQAGTTQTQNLAALLKNYQTAIDATNTALESNGSAMKENEAYMESISAKEQALAAEFEDFANRVLSKELVGGFLDAGKAMLDFANNDVGAAITRIAGFSATIASLVGIAGTVIGKLSEMRALFSATNAAGGLASILTSPKTLLIIAGVAAAIAGIVEVVQALNQAAENRKFENLVKNFEELDKQAKDAADKLEDVKKRLDELNDTPAKDRGQDWQNEIDKLETLKQYYEYIEQMRQGQAAAAQEAAYNAPRTVGVDVSKKVVETDEYSNNFQTYIKEIGQYKTEQEAVYALAAKESISFTNEQTEALSKLSDETEIAAQGYAYLKQNLEAIGYTFSNNIQTASEYALSQGSAMKGLAVQIEETKKYSTELTQAQQEQYDAYIKNNQGQYEYLSGLSNLTTEQQAFVDGYKAMVDAMGDYSTRVQNTSNALQETANAFATYDEILTNYQNAMNGVAGASDEFVASLYDQNGQLTEAAQTLLAGSQQMWSFANAEAAANTAAAQANLNNLIEQLAEVGNTAALSAQQITLMFAAAGLSASVQSTYGDIANDKRAQMAFAAREFQQGDNLQSYLLRTTKESLEKAQKEQQQLQDIGKDKGWLSTGGGGSSGKSAEEKAAEEAEKQAKKAQKAQEKAAKQSQQAYESAAKSAEQAAQEAARAAEQAAEEAKQKILDSIQELKDASDDFWDSKTDAIEETNKELDRQKQLEEKLKALEEARQKKILLYKNGQFQYDKDYGTIAKAQADYEETRDKIQRERELEQLEEMKNNATEIFNEMKDIVQNGGNVTQSMIDNWLSQMQADGVNYYDSNKQLLNEWLEWARSAITEFGQGVVEAVSGISSTSGGTYGSNAQGQVANDTNGARYRDDPLYWKNGEFVGFSVAWWIDRFEEQIKRAQFGGYTESADWLGKMPGTSIFDDWAEVLKYWTTKTSDITGMATEPAGVQDMLERLEAAQIVGSKYRDIFASLDYTDLVEKLDKIADLDVNQIYKEARISGAAAHPEDPFGYRGISPVDYTTVAGKLYNLLNDISSYESYTGSRSAANQAQRGEDYTKMTIAGDLYRSAGLSGYHTASEKMFTDALGDYFPGVKYVNFDEDKLKRFYEDNEAAIKELQEMWFEARTETERQAIHLETEARRQARDYTEEVLGIEPSGKSEAERAANRQAGGAMEARQQEKKNAKNIESIEEVLKAVEKGQDISDGYINSAKDYIANAIKENIEASNKLYSDTEKAKLEEQNKRMQAISDSLTDIQESGLSIKTTDLLAGETTPWATGGKGKNGDDWVRKGLGEDDEIERKRLQMLANAEAWWTTDDPEERKRLHEENERLANEIGGLTYSGTTGTWSKNATGTHNFRGGLSLVGENGPELRVLRRGDNIIPADKTENLWKWASLTPNSMLAAIGNRTTKAGDVSYGFNISNLQLPNVTDAKSLVQGLKNYALQYSYKR